MKSLFNLKIYGIDDMSEKDENILNFIALLRAALFQVNRRWLCQLARELRSKHNIYDIGIIAVREHTRECKREKDDDEKS